MSTTEADSHSGSPNNTCPRPDQVAARCVIGVAQGVAQASRTFADELARDPRPAALPVTSVTAFLSANARFFRELATMVRDVTDSCVSSQDASSTNDGEFEAAARSVAERMSGDAPAASHQDS